MRVPSLHWHHLPGVGLQNPYAHVERGNLFFSSSKPGQPELPQAVRSPQSTHAHPFGRAVKRWHESGIAPAFQVNSHLMQRFVHAHGTDLRRGAARQRSE